MSENPNRSESHDVVAAVDVNHFASDGACQAARQIERRPANFKLINIAVQGSAVALGDMLRAHSARGQRLDRPGGDCIHANVFGAQFKG